MAANALAALTAKIATAVAEKKNNTPKRYPSKIAFFVILALEIPIKLC